MRWTNELATKPILSLCNNWWKSRTTSILLLHHLELQCFESAVTQSPSATMLSSWFYFFLFALIFIYSAAAASSSSLSSTVSYNDHCSSVVPQSNLTIRTHKDSIPFLSTTDFTGGDRLLRLLRLWEPENGTYVYVTRSLKLRIVPDYYETKDTGIYKVQGVLYIRLPYSYAGGSRRNYTYGGSYYLGSRARGLIKFSLDGFWSEISRKLCMVGFASNDVPIGDKRTHVDAVLKMNYATENNPTIYTGIVSGTLESTGSENDPGYFDPISMFKFPAIPSYKYTIVSKEVAEALPSDFDVPRSQSLRLEPNQFCPVIGWRSVYLELEYAVECREEHVQLCSPRGNGVGPMPRFLRLTPIEYCSESERKFRYVAKFLNINYDDGSFNLDSTVIGEASWDDRKNVVFGAACRLLDPSSHFGNAVGDCTMRLSFRFNSILTIVNDAKIVGRIWSTKAVKDSGYFRKIDLTNSDDNGEMPTSWPKYEYTKMDRVRKSCERKPVKKKGYSYPDAFSYNMRLDMSIKDNEGHFAWGSATPIFVGNDSYRRSPILVAVDSIAIAPMVEAEAIIEPVNISPVNISYKIRINPFYKLNSSGWFPVLNGSMNHKQQVEIVAEGVYNAETGYLCMVGCRKLLHNSTISRDCDILVKFEFPPFDAKGGEIKGTIESTRARTDSLHFDELFMQSAAYYGELAKESIWRMDLEITMVLVSNTLACIFIGLQIFHVKRNPEAPSFISIVMLLILSVGQLIPLVLNFEAMFLENHNKQTVVLSNGGRIEANEVTVRVITMAAFLLQIRLLQLVWNAKQTDGNGKSLLTGEKMAGFVSLLLYLLGGLLTLLLNFIRNRYGYQAVSAYSIGKIHSLWGDLRSYAGLILDGFLLPQILLNLFVGSAEKALSHPFYVGTSAVRLVPHAYNQYRAHNYPKFDLNTTYYYANPAADFYSTAWDIIIPCGVVALAVIIFIQQRHGGRCILPQKLRGLEMYEKVPVVDNE